MGGMHKQDCAMTCVSGFKVILFALKVEVYT